MEIGFPKEIAAEEIHQPQLLLACQVQMMQVDQLGNPGKSGMCTTSQESISTVEETAHVDSHWFAAEAVVTLGTIMSPP